MLTTRVPFISLVLLVMAAAGCAAQPVRMQTVSTAYLPPSKPEAAAYATGQLIVKFKPEAAMAVERARTGGTLPRVGIESLDKLFEEYGVMQIDLVFPDRQPTSGEAGLEPNRVYLLRVNTQQDVIKPAALAFSQDTAVEYAEPNYIVTLD